MYRLIFLIVVMTGLAGITPAQSPAERQGIVQDEFIFDKAPYPECHAATLAETKDGLVAAWFGGTKERNPDVCIWVSRKGKGSARWTEGSKVADGIQQDSLRYACWNPVLYQIPGGELLLFYKVGPSPSKWKGWVIKSGDGGVSWSKPEALPEGYLGPIKNKPVLLSNGELICPSSTEGNGWKVHFELTADGGKTWKMIGPVPAGRAPIWGNVAVDSTPEVKTYQAIQPSILFHKDGSLQILCRSQNRAILESWSTDNGRTWSSLKPTGLPNNNSGTDAVTLVDGRQLLVYNHVLPPAGQSKGARSPLNVAVSPDGKDWYAALVLEKDTLGQYSYPSVIQSADGLVHIVYTWRRKKIKHVVLDPSKLALQKIEYGEWEIEQSSDAQYRRPLEQVLREVQSRFGVAIRYQPEMVKDRWVSYADWRFLDDVDLTLKNVLAPLDMDVNKTGPKAYKLKYFEYYRRSYEEGKATLDRLAALYTNKESWEKRKQDLRPCLYEALQLSPLPEKPAAAPVITPWRKMDGYEVANVAIELLPGLYVNGSLYRPLKIKGKIPVILNPDGHWEKQRYRPDCQIRCAALARMGAMAFSYDLFAWGESLLQFKIEDHRRSLAMAVQVLGSIRILDYLLSLKEADSTRVGITGGSGGGTQTVLVTALDDRIKVSAPVVSVSSYFYGGCPCESGMPVHFCAGGTDNVELAAMAAPRPQLLISDGQDWTDHMPEHDFPYLQKVYGYYGAGNKVENIHLKEEGHDYGLSKRRPMYEFMARNLGLKLSAIQDKEGNIDESKCTVEPEAALYVFGARGENLPADAIKGFDNLERVWGERRPVQGSTGTGWNEVMSERKTGVLSGPMRYKVAVVDLMLLKRQKLGAFPLVKTVGADGVEVDMGGLGDRETFDNQLTIDSVRQQFLDKAKELGLGISSLAMTGFYSQSFATRPTYQRMIGDCIQTMKQMNVRVAFLPLGVKGDLAKNPALRPAIVERLKIVGKMAEEAGVLIGIETSLDAAGEVQLLKEIGSPAIQIYFNFANALDAKRDLYKELEILGKDRICQIHCTNTDGVWLQNDSAVDLKKVRVVLDKMGWSGWLVVERSRDAKDPHNVKANFGANTAYVKSIFQ